MLSTNTNNTSTDMNIAKCSQRVKQKHHRTCFQTPHMTRQKMPHSCKEALRILALIVLWKEAGTNLHHIQPKDKERLLKLFECQAFAWLFYHHSKDKHFYRQVRSQQLESAISLVLRVIVSQVNLETGAMGYFNLTGGGDFVYYDYGYLLSHTGLTKQRLFRAMAFLKRYNVITVKRLVTLLPNGYRHKETRIFLNPEFFTWLGLKEAYLEDKKYAIKKRADKMKRQAARMAYLSAHTAHPMQKQIRANPSKPTGQIQSLAQSMTPSYKTTSHVNQSRGNQIKELYQDLLHAGKTPQEAIDIIKQQFPP